VFQEVTNEHPILALALKEKTEPERVEETPSQSVNEVESEDDLVGDFAWQQREDQDI
jgi:hypothetical protein